MDSYLEEMAEILEEDSVNYSDELASFEAWDSLTVLSIIAHCDAEYGVTLSAEEIDNSETVQGLKDLIDSKK